MRANTFIATLALGGGILAGGAVLVPALAQTYAGTGVARGVAANANAPTLHDVQFQLEALGYRDVTKIARERDTIKVRATDSQGRRVDIDVDADNGDIRDTELRRSRVDGIDVEQASWLTIHQVQVKLEAMGYRDIEKIERERNGYEARAIDAQGQRMKLAVAPRSGEVIEGRMAEHADDASRRSFD